MYEDEPEDEELAGPDYYCDVCLRPAPALDSTEIAIWRGGGMAMASVEDPLMLQLRCPDCVDEEDD